MANVLSMNEVTNLLKSQREPTKPKPTDMVDFWNAIPESLESVFSMLSGREFKADPHVTSHLPARPVCIESRFKGDWPGGIVFVMDMSEATAFADIMLGGDGRHQCETLEGESGPALCGTFGQVMGSLCETVSDVAGETVRHEEPKIVEKFLCEPKWTNKYRLTWFAGDAIMAMDVITLISHAFINVLGDSKRRNRVKELKKSIKEMQDELERLERTSD